MPVYNRNAYMIGRVFVVYMRLERPEHASTLVSQ
jgi:hypothetical protein